MQSQTVSVGRLQGGATTHFVAEGAAIVNFLAGVSVGRLQGTATANFLADVSVGRLQAQLSPIF